MPKSSLLEEKPQTLLHGINTGTSERLALSAGHGESNIACRDGVHILPLYESPARATLNELTNTCLQT